ncbi:transporter substrate-binding domain-containing protein [Buttiauxella gaviniae]|uniref:transporter substrate-binding domain-containing protein n=1 Tax=Buttiauxella gaviniae TaxID=82990 RepID=UPI0039752829
MERQLLVNQHKSNYNTADIFEIYNFTLAILINGGLLLFSHLTYCKMIGSFLLAAMIFFCSNAVADPVLNKVLSTHSITLAWVGSSKPISWELNGKPTGMAVDICQDVVDSIKKRYNTNINIQWVEVASAARFEYISHHKADILCAIAGNTAQRNKFVTFSKPWFFTRTNFLAKKSQRINSMEMLSGRTVGAISGGTSALLLSAMNQNINYSISVKLMRSFDEGFDLLEQGHISAFVTDDIIIHSKLAEMADRNDYQMSAEGFGDVIPYGMVIPKDADEIEAIINDELKNLFISKRFDELYNKWFMSPISPTGENMQQPMSKDLIKEKNSYLLAPETPTTD